MKDYKEPKMETVELKEEALEEVNGGVLICDEFDVLPNLSCVYEIVAE